MADSISKKKRPLVPCLFTKISSELFDNEKINWVSKWRTAFHSLEVKQDVYSQCHSLTPGINSQILSIFICAKEVAETCWLSLARE